MDNSTNTTVNEFPYWQLAVALDSLFYLVYPCALFWNITVFVALIKSKLGNKPLIVLYASVMLTTCIDKILEFIITLIIIPDLIRYCICNTVLYPFLLAVSAFSAVFSVDIITFQSLFQLQIVRGKKRWNSYSRIIPCVGISFMLRIITSLLSVVQQIVFPASSNLCQPLCEENQMVLSQVENAMIGVYFVSFLFQLALLY